MSRESKVPAEWSAQNAVWLTWPSMPNWWTGAREESLQAFAKLVAAISKFEKARVNCPAPNDSPEGFSDATDAAKRIACAGANMGNVEFFDHPTNDVWCRDSGAIFRLSADSSLEAIDFKYNSWGGKFPPWKLDDALANKMALAANAKRIDCRKMICEGGALEFDGMGTLLTTECVVLNENRNPSFDRHSAEEYLKDACGVENVIWLRDGLAGDDTDGHIDNLARFAPNNKILAAVCEKSNPSYENLEENFGRLKSAKDARGNSYDTIALPVPPEPVIAKYPDGSERVLPASYANYLVINGAVLVPSYAQKSDGDAAEIISRAFPNREIVQLDCRVFLREGGAIHCLTQQEPLSKTSMSARV